MSIEQEFEQLKTRLLKAEEYEKNKYLTDTPENKERMEKTLKQIIDRMSEIWEQMSKVLELDTNKSVDEWEQEVEKYKADFLYPVKVNYFRKIKRIIVRLERPAFWINPVTKIIE